MREACHHNLYAIAHSCGMNGMGPDTTIKLIRPVVLNTVYGLMAFFGILFVVSLVLFVVKKNRFKKTDAYREFREFKAANK